MSNNSAKQFSQPKLRPLAKSKKWSSAPDFNAIIDNPLAEKINDLETIESACEAQLRDIDDFLKESEKSVSSSTLQELENIKMEEENRKLWEYNKTLE